MGNRKAREFVQRQAEKTSWRRALTEPRSADVDIGVTGIGFRRAQLIVLPSFEPGRAWEVRHLTSCSLFASAATFVDEGITLCGYERLAVDSVVLASFLDRMRLLSLPYCKRLLEL